MRSVTEDLASAREDHFMACRDIVGAGSLTDYDERNLRSEALMEAADLYNYLCAMGEFDLAEMARCLGDRIAELHDD